MKMPDVGTELLTRAREGDLAALDELLHTIQPAVFNLAVRMLGHREDARDATQDILLKVVTHLATFRGEAAFGTWVWQIARNHLLNAGTRAREVPQVSFEELGGRLDAGMSLAPPGWQDQPLLPEDKLDARELAIRCTQGMLMRLDRGHRIAYLLDTAFGLSSELGGEVLDITAAAYRKRVSRARQALESFAAAHCGLANAKASCRCEAQVSVLRRAGVNTPENHLPLGGAERDEAVRALDELEAFSGFAGVFRAHPQYQAPGAIVAAIRAVLRDAGELPAGGERQ